MSIISEPVFELSNPRFQFGDQVLQIIHGILFDWWHCEWSEWKGGDRIQGQIRTEV